jgi:hypothetical protein
MMMVVVVGLAEPSVVHVGALVEFVEA